MPGRHIVSSFVSNYCFATLSCSVWTWRQQLLLCVYWSQHLVIDYCRLLSLDMWSYQQRQVSHCQWWNNALAHNFCFLMLIVSPNSLQAWESLSISCRRSSIVWVTSATSFAKSICRMTTCLTFVLALNRARLNSLPSALVCRKTPSVDVLKAYYSIVEKNMLNSVGARTHPCFTPLWISNCSDVAPS